MGGGSIPPAVMWPKALEKLFDLKLCFCLTAVQVKNELSGSYVSLSFNHLFSFISSSFIYIERLIRSFGLQCKQTLLKIKTEG